MKNARDELVRIDERGQAHPIGAIAAARMRAREGAYRILPAPQHVVLMRYTGEDGRRDEHDGAVVRLGGEIVRAGVMCEISGLLAQSGWTGELVVFDGQNQRSLFFEQSSVVGVETDCTKEHLGEVMFRFGGITQDQHAQLLATQSHQERTGATAVNLGFVSPEAVYKYLRQQAELVFYNTLLAEDGTYFFLDGFDPSRILARQTLSANALLMDGVTRLDEIRYFREKIPSSEYVPRRTATSAAPAAEFSATYAAVDDASDIAELGRVTGKGEFAITRDVYALLRSRHLELGPPVLGGGSRAVVALGNDALRIVHRTVDAAGRGTALRERLGEFAVGAGVYDILFRGAGPAESGTLDPERVAKNSELVSADNPGLVLRQMLHDYIGFAIFSASSLLGAEAEQDLQRQVGATLRRLQPGD